MQPAGKDVGNQSAAHNASIAQQDLKLQLGSDRPTVIVGIAVMRGNKGI